ncbi:unnamed protein product [Schistocephalus solidus]|uniref:C2H2-type domain-containing protein n=1 Tax=Schistocephalus solidus TaxID=70667 RepID=A0A183T9E0_SCHSO|nr:unnamed protein product [Schistocephalus solidus]
MRTKPTTDNHSIDTPPPILTDTIRPPPLAPTRATKATCPNATNSVATSNYLPLAISTIPTTGPGTSDGDSVITWPHCDRTFTSRIGPVSHLRIHHTETGEPMPRTPTYTHRIRINCPHCLRTFTHHMDLLGHMRFHENLR